MRIVDDATGDYIEFTRNKHGDLVIKAYVEDKPWERLGLGDGIVVKAEAAQKLPYDLNDFVNS